MKHILLLLIVISNFSCSKNKIASEKKNPEKTFEEKMYELINFIVDESCEFKYLSVEKLNNIPKDVNDFLKFKRLDTIFSKQDVALVYNQISKMEGFQLKQNLIPNKIVIQSDSIKKLYTDNQNTKIFWENFHKKYGKEGFCSISKPVFSTNMQIAIVSISCSAGSFGGSTNINIYKYENGKWKFFLNLLYGVS